MWIIPEADEVLDSKALAELYDNVDGTPDICNLILVESAEDWEDPVHHLQSFLL